MDEVERERAALAQERAEFAEEKRLMQLERDKMAAAAAAAAAAQREDAAASSSQALGLGTRFAHAGCEVDPTTGALTPAIHLSSTFERDTDLGYSKGFCYARKFTYTIFTL